MSKATEIFKGSSNVFADIGLPNAKEHLVKASLVHKVMRIMRERNLNQVQTAELLGVGQPEVSNMIRGRFERISVDKLLRHLVALGHDVEIAVKSVPRERDRPPEVRIV